MTPTVFASVSQPGPGGPAGPPGYTPQFIVAAGPPNPAAGNNGDMWIDSVTGDVWGPKVNNAWGNVVCNIEGPPGPQGPPGSGDGSQTPWLSNIEAATFELHNVSKIGIANTAPAYPLDVVGDVNITGVYRVNGVPLATGGGNQTPWISDIDAGGFKLNNLTGIGIGGGQFAQAGFAMYISSSAYYDSLKQVNPSATGYAGFALQNDTGKTFSFRVYGSGRSTGNLAMIESQGDQAFGTNAVERMRITQAGLVGIGTQPVWALDVLGDVNVSGVFRINGVPLSTGGGGSGSQTPWISNIDAQTFELHNVSKIGVGTPTPHASLHVTLGAIFGADGSLGSPNQTYIDGASGSRFMQFNAASSMTTSINSTAASFFMGGNIGIGTVVPAAPMHIVSSVQPSLIVQQQTAQSVCIELRDAAVTANRWWLAMGINSPNDGMFAIYDARQSAARLTISAAGNVGISTASPAATLDVNGTIRSIGMPTVPASGAGIELIYTNGNGYVNAYDRTAAAYHPLIFNGAVTVTAAGSVGIANPAPGTLLHVAGDVTRQLYLSGGATHANQMRIGYDVSTNIGTIETFMGASGGWTSINPGGAAVNLASLTWATPVGVAVGVGNPFANSRLTLIPATQPGTVAAAQQLTIGEAGQNPQYYLSIGYGPVWHYQGVIQSYEGNAPGPLVINPSGGMVGIGTISPYGTGGLTIVNGSPSTVAGANQIMIGEGSFNSQYYFSVGFAAMNGAWSGVLQSIGGGAAAQTFINPSGGNVAVGMATNPQATLHVLGPSNDPQNIYGSIVASGGSSAYQVRIGYNASTNYGWIQAVQDQVGLKPLSLNANGGFVGIGLTIPSYQLDVNGNINCRGSFLLNGAPHLAAEMADLNLRIDQLTSRLAALENR